MGIQNIMKQLGYSFVAIVFHSASFIYVKFPIRYAQKTTATATMTLVGSMGNNYNNTEANSSTLEKRLSSIMKMQLVISYIPIR